MLAIHFTRYPEWHKEEDVIPKTLREKQRIIIEKLGGCWHDYEGVNGLGELCCYKCGSKVFYPAPDSPEFFCWLVEKMQLSPETSGKCILGGERCPNQAIWDCFACFAKKRDDYYIVNRADFINAVYKFFGGEE